MYICKVKFNFNIMEINEIITEMWHRVRISEDKNYVRSSDICNIINRIRIEENKSVFNATQWLNSNPVKELISTLKEERVIKKGKGRGAATWLHPVLAIEMLMMGGGPKAKLCVFENSNILSKLK